MKHRTKSLLILCILFILLLAVPLISCSVSLSYGEFVFQGIEKGIMIENPEEYLLDPKYDEYRVDDVIVIPQVKRIGGDQYVIDFILFSGSEGAKAVISHVSLLNNGHEISIPSGEITISLSQAGTGSNIYFEGSERFCSIPAETLNTVNGEKYELDFLLCIEKPYGKRIERHMTYYADVVQYKTLVLPT